MEHNQAFFAMLERTYGEDTFKTLKFSKGKRIENNLMPKRLYYIKKEWL